jgi:hypothetical protein
MALFGSASSKEVDVFAKGLVEELLKRYPPMLDKEGARKLSQKRLTSILEEAFVKASGFKKQHKLSIYKTARLGNTFRWELQERGYSEKFVETATEGLVVYMTRKNI